MSTETLNKERGSTLKTIQVYGELGDYIITVGDSMVATEYMPHNLTFWQKIKHCFKVLTSKN